MTSESDSEWFLKDNEGTLGPLSESDMRKHIEKSTDDALLIRQGSSDWRSVDVIRRKITLLQKNGIFVRYKQVAEGPFTLTRAHDVLKRMTPGGIDVRTGATGPWVPADKWLAKIDNLLEMESKDMDSLSVAVQHVLGRKGFTATAHNSGELDLADASSDIAPAPKEAEPAIERPLWLAPAPSPETTPDHPDQPIFEAKVISSPTPSSQDRRWKQHTEPVIEVVKVMHAAEITDRAVVKAKAKNLPPTPSTSSHHSQAANPASIKTEAAASNVSQQRPDQTINRVRPRNHTSQINRTRTSQEKLVIACVAAATVTALLTVGWKWATETDTNVAASQVGQQPTIINRHGAESRESGKLDKDATKPADHLKIVQPEHHAVTAGGEQVESGKPKSGDVAGITRESKSSPRLAASKQPDSESQPLLTEKGEKLAGTSITAPPDNSKRTPITLTPGTLFYPRFGTSEGEVKGGTAFAAKLNGKSQILILSALNLFGPAGGLKADIEADKLTTAWKRLVVEDCKTQNYFGEIQMQPIHLSGAKPHPQKSDLGDIAACAVDDPTAIEALSLSQRIPSNGERVWLISRLPGSSDFMHPATVERFHNGWLRYSFGEDIINLPSTGGAPVIDHKGKVIAVNANITKTGGKLIGHGTPVVNFYPTLATLVQ